MIPLEAAAGSRQSWNAKLDGVLRRRPLESGQGTDSLEIFRTMLRLTRQNRETVSGNFTGENGQGMPSFDRFHSEGTKVMSGKHGSIQQQADMVTVTGEFNHFTPVANVLRERATARVTYRLIQPRLTANRGFGRCVHPVRPVFSTIEISAPA